MEIIEQIGAYAGFGAVLGLAVLSALYFSQARDLRRLREWAGRAPERAGELATEQPRVVARPVPRAPGAAAASPPAGGAPAPGGAAAAVAGAGPAVATGPAAATPAARAAGATQVPDAQSTANGSDQGSGVSEDTMAHPPPAVPGGSPPEVPPGTDTGETDRASEGADDAKHEDLGAEAEAEDAEPERGEGDEEDGDVDEGDYGESDREGEEYGEADPDADYEEYEDYEDEPVAPEAAGFDRDAPEPDALEPEGLDDTGERPPPAVPSPPRRPPSPPSRLPQRPPPFPGRPAAGTTGGRGTTILPPYERSRPGGDPWYRTILATPRTTAIAAGAIVLVLVLGVLAVTRLTGDEDQAASVAERPTALVEEGNGRDGAGAPDGGAPTVDPSTVTVSVLNGTTVSGLAAEIGDEVQAEGFQVGTVTNNFDQTRAESVVLYAPGAELEARAVSRVLGVPQRETADADSQSLAGDAAVIVVVGADQSQ